MIPKFAVRTPRVGTLPGGANYGSNKLASEAVVQATRSLNAKTIQTMAAPQLASTLRNVNRAFESNLGPNASLMKDSSFDLVGDVQVKAEVRPILEALEYRRTELTAQIENTRAPGGSETTIKTLISRKYLAKFHWDTLGSTVHHTGKPLSDAFGFNPKTDPEFLGIKLRLGQLNLAADHNSTYFGAQALSDKLRPLVNELTEFITPFKTSWATPKPAKEAIEQLQAVREQMQQTLALLEQHTELISARPPSFFQD